MIAESLVDIRDRYSHANCATEFMSYVKARLGHALEIVSL